MRSALLDRETDTIRGSMELKTKDDYELALERIEQLYRSNPNSDEFAELFDAIEAYEAIHENWNKG